MSLSSTLTGQFLVHGTPVHDDPQQALLVEVVDLLQPHPLLVSHVSLSFWGGIDPVTGIVVDTSHPLHGQCVTDTVLCLPSGRGSCTASQVLLELILNQKAPKAFCFRDVDGLACVGAIIAQEVFPKQQRQVPDMIHIGTQAFHDLLGSSSHQHQQHATHACVLPSGDLMIGDLNTVRSGLEQWKIDHDDIRHSMQQQAIQLTEQEQSMLDNASTEAQRMAYRVIFQYARLGASSSSSSSSKRPSSYESITQAHIDGCTYIGPGGLEFTQRLVQAKGQVQVPTTLNSVSADRRHHQALGVPAEYAANSIALGDAYLALGCQPSFTCAPYLLPRTPPKLGDQIAWGESNAVVYANSVLGARTEKYADYLDICCAITGIIPSLGVHLEENRVPQVILDATELLHTVMQAKNDKSNVVNINLEMLFPTLGHVCGSLSDGKVPILVGFNTPEWIAIVNEDHLKAFCAAFGTTGTSPLVHIDGITPEARQYPSYVLDETSIKKTVTWEHCHETFATLNTAMKNSSSAGDPDNSRVDLIALGNPHLSVQECHNLVKLIQTMSSDASTPMKKHPSVRIMACVSRAIHSQAEKQGYIQFLREFGVEFINDTCWCMLLDPPVIPANPDAVILTNSGKYAHYGPGLTSRKYRYGSTEDCVHVAITGVYPSAVSKASDSHNGMPSWLLSKSHMQQRRSFTTVSSARCKELVASVHVHKSMGFAFVPRPGNRTKHLPRNTLKRITLQAFRSFLK
jgi:cis-L-3-hydroxyproline dehydratase